LWYIFNNIMKNKITKLFLWPQEKIPEIMVAGRFYHECRSFQRKYYNKQTACIHLYEYPGTIRIGEHSFEFHHGDITVIPCYTEYTYDVPVPGHHYCIHFRNIEIFRRKKDLLSFPFIIRPAELLKVDLLKSKLLEIINFRSLPEKSSGNAAASISLMQFLFHISLFCRNNPEKRKSYSVNAISKAASIIEDNLHLPLKIPDLANECKLSQNYLSRVFRKHYGMTMTRYQMKKRMEMAVQLILNSDKRIKEIGNECGIPDPQHFNKLFRRITGSSPSAMRCVK